MQTHTKPAPDIPKWSALLVEAVNKPGLMAEPQPVAHEASDTLQTIEALLLRMIGQSETAFRVESLSLELLQETLAEARAGRLEEDDRQGRLFHGQSDQPEN